MLELEDDPSDARTKRESKGHEDARKVQLPGAILLAVELAEIRIRVGSDTGDAEMILSDHWAILNDKLFELTRIRQKISSQ